VRVILADDAVVVREGVARLLDDHGIEVVAQVGDADALRRVVRDARVDVVVTDIRMPPDFTDDGLRAAEDIRAERPEVAVLVLSQYVDVAYAVRLMQHETGGVGYLLKDRILDVPALIEAMRRVAAGESIVEPSLVQELVDAPKREDPLAALTPREREVLALMAEGRTDRGIREGLWVSQKTVEAHVRSIFRKLDLPATPSENRRVHAVLAFLKR
jgi:DNA-binding NarL/FixJ family response regulator